MEDERGVLNAVGEHHRFVRRENANAAGASSVRMRRERMLPLRASIIASDGF